MKDALTIGAIAGTIGILIIQGISMVLAWLGIIEMTILDVAALLFLNEAQANTAAGMMVGFITHLLTGATGGVILAYIIKFTGDDYYWVKGLALGGIMNLGFMGFAVTLLGIAPEMRTDAVTMLVHIIEQFIFGLISAYIIVKFGRFEIRGI